MQMVKTVSGIYSLSAIESDADVVQTDLRVSRQSHSPHRPSGRSHNRATNHRRRHHAIDDGNVVTGDGGGGDGGDGGGGDGGGD